MIPSREITVDYAVFYEITKLVIFNCHKVKIQLPHFKEGHFIPMSGLNGFPVTLTFNSVGNPGVLTMLGKEYHCRWLYWQLPIDQIIELWQSQGKTATEYDLYLYYSPVPYARYWHEHSATGLCEDCSELATISPFEDNGSLSPGWEQISVDSMNQKLCSVCLDEEKEELA